MALHFRRPGEWVFLSLVDREKELLNSKRSFFEAREKRRGELLPTEERRLLQKKKRKELFDEAERGCSYRGGEGACFGSKGFGGGGNGSREN